MVLYLFILNHMWPHEENQVRCFGNYLKVCVTQKECLGFPGYIALRVSSAILVSSEFPET